MQVVAEGIETEAIWSALSALERYVAQGYYISRPLSAAAFDVWLSTSKWAPSRAAIGVALT